MTLTIMTVNRVPPVTEDSPWPRAMGTMVE